MIFLATMSGGKLHSVIYFSDRLFYFINETQLLLKNKIVVVHL